MRHPRLQWWTVGWLAVVWVLLWGDLSVPNVLVGIVVGVVVSVLYPMAPIEMAGRLHLRGLARLIGRFAVDLVHASFQVAALALRVGWTPRGAIVAVHLRSHSDLYLTLTAELCSLVPGSIVVEAHRLTGTLYVHLLDVETAGGLDAARDSVLDLEARVLRALASDAELAEAGITRSPRTASGARG